MVQGSPSRWIVHDPSWMNFTMVFSRHRSRYPGTGVLDAVTDTAQQCGAHALRAVWCSRPVGIQPTTKPYLSFFYPVPSIPRTRIIAADLEGTFWVFSMRDKRDCKAARFVERVQFESRKRTNLDHT